MDEIDVVIPMHNSAQWVEGALDSLLEQGPCLGQVICVDNNSSDNSSEAVQAWGQAHPNVRLKLIEERTPGAGAARNAGLKEVNTVWVQFLDSDDLLRPKKMATQRALGQDHDMVYGHFMFSREDDAAVLAVLGDERRPCVRPRPRSNRPNHQQLVSHRIGSRRRWLGRITLQRARVRPDVPHVQGGRAIHHVGGPFDHRQAVSRGAHFNKQRSQTPAQLVCASHEDVGARSIGAWRHGRSETTRLECVVQHHPLARTVRPVACCGGVPRALRSRILPHPRRANSKLVCPGEPDAWRPTRGEMEACCTTMDAFKAMSKSARKRVLVVSYYWPPSGGGGVQRWLKFAKLLPSSVGTPSW